MRTLFTITIAVVLAACSSGPTREEINARWTGRPIAELEQQIGMPSRIVESASGQIVYLYAHQSSYRTPVVAQQENIGIGMGGPFEPKPRTVYRGGQTITKSCSIEVFIDPETRTVNRINWRGDGC